MSILQWRPETNGCPMPIPMNLIDCIPLNVPILFVFQIKCFNLCPPPNRDPLDAESHSPLRLPALHVTGTRC